MKRSYSPDRREFLRGLGRGAGLGALLLGAGGLMERPGSAIEECINTGAENQHCPTGAIKRAFVEDPYYEYTIDEELCIGCAVCVKGCAAFGNGSLFLQVRHDRCLNCNECSIAKGCPSQAYTRVPASQPYLLKNRETKI